ncbi:MAG: hypothetical protein JWO67_4498 [Streptosporangiaceae bacterium]|nr:hypothetical protein [Streptosporangiaceae bacterium]
MITTDPEVQLIPVDRLLIDGTVQRALDKPRVDRMAADYKSEALGVIVVSSRSDGTIHVIDGQHRLAATRAAGFGEAKLNCLVYTGLTRPEEAALFRRLNATKAIQPVDKFRVRVVEGDPAAVRINMVLERHGWTVAMSKSAGAFAAVSAIEGVYTANRNGASENIGIIETLVSIITAAWGHDSDGMRAEIVTGLGAMLLRHDGQVDVAKLVAGLSSFPGGPRALVGKAKGLRDLLGGKVGDSMAEILVNLLNKNRRTNLLPEWRSAA